MSRSAWQPRTDDGPPTDQGHCRASPEACYGRPPYPPHRCPQLWTTVWTCLHAGRMPSTNRERNAIGSQREGVSTTRLREVHVDRRRGRVDRRRTTPARAVDRIGVVLDVPGRRPGRLRRDGARRPGAEHPRPRPDPQSLPGDRHRGDGGDRHRWPSLRRPDRARRVGRRPASFDELLADPSAYSADNGNGRRSTDGFSSDAALDEAGLNPRYTFDTFVKGASNQFPLAAAPARRRDAGPFLQPAVHLRLGGSRQDPSAPRHRALRASQLPAPRGALRLDRDVHERVRRRHPLQRDGRAAPPVSRRRRPAHRRRAVPRGQRRPARGVLSHVQRAPRRQQADRDLERPRPRRHPDARGAVARPIQVGSDHRHPAARPRDPPRHLAQQVRTRSGPGAGRDARVHRQPHQHQHP